MESLQGKLVPTLRWGYYVSGLLMPVSALAIQLFFISADPFFWTPVFCFSYILIPQICCHLIWSCAMLWGSKGFWPCLSLTLLNLGFFVLFVIWMQFGAR